jgi:phosphoglycolate phosphatase-like HAD superfamily hydrolase
MKLVLFDIDGTLLWTDGAGRRAVTHALVDIAGTAGPIDTYRLDGKTDPQIVEELLALAGHPAAQDEASVAAVLERYVTLLEAELAGAPGSSRLMPGVAELLAGLERHEADEAATVGLLTGNLARGAELKLRSAGLDPRRFAVGAFGSDARRRTDLPAIAVERASRHRDRRFAGSDVVIVGDTPADVTCGAAIGARSVGVATGFYDAAALRAAGATHVFDSLSDTSRVLAALLERP